MTCPPTCISCSSRETEPKVYKEIYYKEMAYAIMKAKRSHDPLSVSWRPQRASGGVPVQTWKPENQGSQWSHLDASPCLRPERWCPRAGEDGCPSLKQRVNSPFLHIFSIQALNELDDAHLALVRVTFFTQFNSNANLFRCTLTDISKHNVLSVIWISLSQSSYMWN